MFPSYAKTAESKLVVIKFEHGLIIYSVFSSKFISYGMKKKRIRLFNTPTFNKPRKKYTRFISQIKLLLRLRKNDV